MFFNKLISAIDAATLYIFSIFLPTICFRLLTRHKFVVKFFQIRASLLTPFFQGILIFRTKNKLIFYEKN
jgi:hypothetical protein